MARLETSRGEKEKGVKAGGNILDSVVGVVGHVSFHRLFFVSLVASYTVISYSGNMHRREFLQFVSFVALLTILTGFIFFLWQLLQAPRKKISEGTVDSSVGYTSTQQFVEGKRKGDK